MTIESICQQAKTASRRLARLSGAEKDAALLRAADQVWAERDAILAANQTDLAAGQANGLTPALLDRLMLNEQRLAGIIADLRALRRNDPAQRPAPAQTAHPPGGAGGDL